MIKKSKKGFTIIELIVVIAIIAVLAGIVLINVTQYINKGKNAAIEGNLSTLLTDSATYFDTTTGGTGATFIASSYKSDVSAAITNAGGSLNVFGDPASQAWCGSSSTLAAGSTPASTFCVDSTGYKGVLGSGKCATGVYTCQ